MRDTYLQRLEADLGARYSPDTKRTFLTQARLFLRQVGGKNTYGRQDILGYVDHLIEAGKAASTIHTALSGIKHLFRAIDHPWPLEARELHLRIPRSSGGPALAHDEVGQLIKAVRLTDPPVGHYYYVPQTIVALSTVYGLRPIEIQRALRQGCSGEVLELQSAKGGKVRQHAIPEVVRNALEFPPTKASRSTLGKVFKDLMRSHVRPKRKGEGWHAVRRSLVTGLLDDGVPMHTVTRFMGWKLPDTAFGYYRPSQDDLDQTIFEAHPFLEFWR